MMKVGELIEKFEGRTLLPIDVNEVRDCLRANGREDDIEFIGVDLDPDILQGKIKIAWTHDGVYGEPTRYVNIYYHRGHVAAWQRFICCKELLHVLDPEKAQTKTREEIAELSARIGLPREMQDPIADGIQANVDRLAEFRAAAVLLPMAARELLLPALSEDKISLDDVARLADIPRKYAGFVMAPVWEKLYPLLKMSS